MTHTYDDEQIAMNGVYPPTLEKETPTPKTVEEVVYEQTYIMHPNYPNDSFITKKDLERILVAQNQAADERLRDAIKAIVSAADLTPYAEEHNGELVDCSFYQIYKGKLEAITAKHGITNL